MSTLVTTRGLTKTYQRGPEKIEVLHGIDLDIPKGDFVALMGPSGSGKTTLLNLIGGLDTPTSGEIEIEGERIDRMGAGQLSNWLGKADGGFAGNDANAFRQVGLDWQVAGVGDYDGDKRDDILWRNTTTGALSDWLGQANGGFAGNDGNALVTGVSLTWHNPVFDSFAV